MGTSVGGKETFVCRAFVAACLETGTVSGFEAYAGLGRGRGLGRDGRDDGDWVSDPFELSGKKLKTIIIFL